MVADGPGKAPAEGFRGLELDKAVGDCFLPQLNQFAPGTPTPLLQPETPTTDKQVAVATTSDQLERVACMANSPLLTPEKRLAASDLGDEIPAAGLLLPEK